MAEPNIDFIGVVTSDGTHQQYSEIPIEKSQSIIDELKTFLDNPDSTVIEMQEKFLEHFPEKKSYNFCHPWGYTSSCYDYFFGGGSFPASISQDDYDSKLNESESRFREEGSRMYNDHVRAEGYVERKLNEFKKKCKSSKYRDYVDYIHAFDYYRLLEMISADDSVKMYSTEPVGAYGRLSYMEYQINDDMKFAVKTNFRYGWASHFYLNMIYKGVEMLFYSDYVKYYFASQCEIVDYTRNYVPKSSNWPVVLKFVAETSNLASADPEQFIRHFVSHEIEEMMAGLRKFMTRRDSVRTLIERMTDYANDDSPYIGLRHISNSEREEYKIHPEEMEITFKMEKLSGALKLLESMEVFHGFYPGVDAFIEEIRQMNRLIAPELKTLISDVDADIKRLERNIERLESELEDLDARLKPFTEEIESKTNDFDYSQRSEFTSTFKKEHPIYVQILNDISNNINQKSTFTSDKYYRSSYKERLEECLSTIVDAGLAAT